MKPRPIRAAVRLSIAQPVLSRQIKLLEAELGAELFYRNGRGIVLSEAGKLLETYARSILNLVDQAQLEIGSLRAVPRGRVAIAMPPSIGWMLTWLENPPIFPTWVKLRRQPALTEPAF